MPARGKAPKGRGQRRIWRELDEMTDSQLVTVAQQRNNEGKRTLTAELAAGVLRNRYPDKYTLAEFLPHIPAGTTVSLGSLTAYFEIAPVDDIKDPAYLDWLTGELTRAARLNGGDGIAPLGSRTVLNYYHREEPGHVAVIVEGNERGGYWVQEDKQNKKCLRIGGVTPPRSGGKNRLPKILDITDPKMPLHDRGVLQLIDFVFELVIERALDGHDQLAETIVRFEKRDILDYGYFLGYAPDTVLQNVAHAVRRFREKSSRLRGYPESAGTPFLSVSAASGPVTGHNAEGYQYTHTVYLNSRIDWKRTICGWWKNYEDSRIEMPEDWLC